MTVKSQTNETLSPELQRWMDKGYYFNSAGHQIFAIDEGDKSRPVVLLIHGFPTSSWDFEPMWPALSSKYRIVCLDMLGFGFSDKPNTRDYTIHKQADLFDDLLISLEITEYHILTHDYGVSVAQEILARQSNRQSNTQCLSCCFLNGGLFPETHQALFVQKALLGKFGKLVNALTGYNMFAKSFSRVFGQHSKPSPEELKLFWEAINYNNGRPVFYNLITYMNDRREHRERWLQPLVESKIPLALINGSQDPVSGAHLVTRYKELGCRLDYLAELTELGHYPHTEDAARVAQHYFEFMDAITPETLTPV